MGFAEGTRQHWKLTILILGLLVFDLVLYYLATLAPPTFGTGYLRV